MRIFIALRFEEVANDIIYNTLKKVKTISETGNFSSKKNLHLTVLYIGETSKETLEAMKSKLMEITLKRFDYTANRIRTFKKSSSRLVVYLEVDKIESLENLYLNVHHKLKEIGVSISSEKYTPHITLGRQVLIKTGESLQNIDTVNLLLKAKSISIMESTREGDLLVYKERFNIPLK
ncbi:MAG: RNA 2',3'-cyclic phosphodiesterase [Tenericutes bacterium]|nr:RNA 2',3'-cyclic phosphodiesterase [Mycoplasmatota bacterium]